MRPDPAECSQASLQIDVSCPFPIRTRIPISRKSRARRMLLQVADRRSPSTAVSKDSLEKYMDLIIYERRRWGCIFMRYACLASRDKLKLSRSLNPIPPSAYGRQSFSQAIHDIDRPVPDPHKYWWIILSKSFRLPLGRRNQLITYVGMDCRTDLISTSRSAIDSFFSLQPSIRDHKRSLR